MPRYKEPTICFGYDSTKTKTCTGPCGEKRPRTVENWAESEYYDLLKPVCRMCQNEYAREWNSKKLATVPGAREAKSEAHREWIAEHPGYYTKASGKRRWAVDLLRTAKNRKSFEVTVTEEDVLELYEKQGGMCYHLKLVKMLPSLTTKHPLQPSLDRLDSSKGYVIGNVVLSTLWANFAKSNLPVERFEELCRALPRALTRGEIIETDL